MTVSFETTFHLHTIKCDLNWVLSQSSSTYPAVLTDDVELDTSGVGDEPALLCLTSEATSVKIITIICHDVRCMKTKDCSSSCLWLDQHKTSPVDSGLQISMYACTPTLKWSTEAEIIVVVIVNFGKAHPVEDWSTVMIWWQILGWNQRSIQSWILQCSCWLCKSNCTSIVVSTSHFYLQLHWPSARPVSQVGPAPAWLWFLPLPSSLPPFASSSTVSSFGCGTLPALAGMCSTPSPVDDAWALAASHTVQTYQYIERELQ